jgi:signal transduction histidine kinase
MKSRQYRGWLLYAAAWVPIALVYGQLIGAQRGVGGLQALYSGIDYTLTPALLGVAVWWVSGKIRWPASNAVAFFVAHIAIAIAYTIVWLAVVVGSIALGTGWTRALAITRTFAGWQVTYGIWAYGIIAGISYAIRISRSLREKEAARARAEAARATAELSALRGQLNPHFLFNTLHTVIALVRREPQMAEAALEQFGEMLRYVLDVNRAEQEDVQLADEMEFVRNFLSLEQLRLGERLRVIEDVSADALDCVIPSLTLQPLVENAVKYAVAPKTSGGTIEIKASLHDSSLVLEVIDDGPGAGNGVEAGSGVGLRAVRQRLEARYPNASSFEARSRDGGGFAVRLMLPAIAGQRKAGPRPVAGHVHAGAVRAR